MPAESTPTTRHASRPPACASAQASEFSPDHVLQHRLVETEVGHNLAQLRVLVLELPQPTHLRRQQPVVPLLPVEVRRLADPRLAADLGHSHPVMTLLQDERL